MLLSEGAFAAGMVFSYLKLVHIFSINPHLGPLQVSLGRMIIDIIKFFFIYTLVLFASVVVSINCFGTMPNWRRTSATTCIPMWLTLMTRRRPVPSGEDFPSMWSVCLNS